MQHEPVAGLSAFPFAPPVSQELTICSPRTADRSRVLARRMTVSHCYVRIVQLEPFSRKHKASPCDLSTLAGYQVLCSQDQSAACRS